MFFLITEENYENYQTELDMVLMLIILALRMLRQEDMNSRLAWDIYRVPISKQKQKQKQNPPKKT
jgi:hypothetical protein